MIIFIMVGVMFLLLPDTRYNLGIAQLKRGNREGALKQYREISKFDAGIAAALKKEIDATRR